MRKVLTSWPAYLSYTVNDLFSVEYWRDLEMWVVGRLRLLEMAPFH